MKQKVSILFLKIILSAFVTFSQTQVDERKCEMTYRDTYSCYAFNYTLTFPVFSAFSLDDMITSVNDSIKQIVKVILTSNPPLMDGYETVCDSSQLNNAETVDMTYQVIQNTGRLLSVLMYVDWVAGGGGNGFNTNIYDFNIDIYNNQILSIDSLFDSLNKVKLQAYFKKNITRITEGHLLDETHSEINLFGKTGEESYGSLEYAGFGIDSSFLKLYYNKNYGRGSSILDIKLPLGEIKRFINKKYVLLFPGDDNLKKTKKSRP